ncbi:hypothetical protein GCM10010174_07770 [Kutzneria viridogrisea]|uniref:Uncharacterized protein n=1 Tax=Kutzneria viridogrisea TaxID=47990 RepID=A0ABR6BXF3_9PSEU|nr:hypothetical protein [Kutzneria viridogrisea]
MKTSIQLRGEEQVGDRIYAVEVRADAEESVIVDIAGELTDGTVIAEGGLVLPVGDLMTAGRLLEQTLRGLSVMQGNGKALAKSRSAPANAGRPWTEEQDAELARLWTEGAAAIPELALQFARSRWSIRARLIHLGLDPEREYATDTEITNE